MFKLELAACLKLNPVEFILFGFEKKGSFEGSLVTYFHPPAYHLHGTSAIKSESSSGFYLCTGL